MVIVIYSFPPLLSLPVQQPLRIWNRWLQHSGILSNSYFPWQGQSWAIENCRLLSVTRTSGMPCLANMLYFDICAPGWAQLCNSHIPGIIVHYHLGLTQHPWVLFCSQCFNELHQFCVLFNYRSLYRDLQFPCFCCKAPFCATAEKTKISDSKADREWRTFLL